MSNGKRETDLLDRALRDLSPEQRARVLDLTLRLDIDRDDPLWLICLAIGQLQVLVEDAPADWKETFEAFSTDLEAWTATNLKALEAIANQAEAGAELAETSKKLTDTLSDLSRLLSAQNKRPPTSRQDIRNLQKKLEGWKENLDQQTASITASLEILKSGENTKNTWIALSKASSTASITKWLLMGLVVLNGGGLYFLWKQQEQSSQHLKWLLYKANRLECVQGIVEKLEPQCKDFRK